MLPNRIRELRKERKLTQHELGILVKRDNASISRIERGEVGLSAEDMEAFARVFKVKPWELFAVAHTN